MADHWCMYKVEDGQVINQLFEPSEIPNGWYDSPKAARAALAPVPSRKVKKRKIKNGNNSTRPNK